jgi:hypothetical protein
VVRFGAERLLEAVLQALPARPTIHPILLLQDNTRMARKPGRPGSRSPTVPAAACELTP